MALFLVTRPHGAEHLKNPQGVHAALVDAASGPTAISAANALAPCVLHGDALGTSYTGPGRGA